MKDSGFFVPPGKSGNILLSSICRCKVTAKCKRGFRSKIQCSKSAQGKTDDKIDWKISEGNKFGSQVQPFKPTFDSAGGWLYASLNDYASYCAMILNGGIVGDNRILKAETLEPTSE